MFRILIIWSFSPLGKHVTTMNHGGKQLTCMLVGKYKRWTPIRGYSMFKANGSTSNSWLVNPLLSDIQDDLSRTGEVHDDRTLSLAWLQLTLRERATIEFVNNHLVRSIKTLEWVELCKNLESSRLTIDTFICSGLSARCTVELTLLGH